MGAAAAGAAGWDYGDEEQFTTGTHTPAPSSRPSESGGVDWCDLCHSPKHQQMSLG
jgi:hypothetical protein